MIRKLTLAAATASLAMAPIAIEAAHAAPQPATVDRASETVGSDEQLAGGADFGRALIIAAIAAVGMIFLLVTDDEDEAVSN